MTIAVISVNNPNEEDDPEKGDFEKAISATGFGKFNFLLILAIVPSSMCPIIDNTIMSFVTPVAECDLNLSLQEKGFLNASAFIGFLISAYFWGFLADTIGRKKVLQLTYIGDFLCTFISAFFQTFWFQFIFKFISGFIISGPYGIIMAYVSEFHCNAYRSKTVLAIGVSMVLVLVYMPFVAMFVFPLEGFVVTNDYVFHSWQLYIIIMSIPSLLASTAFIFLPETPKYLMSIGQNDKALKLFRKIYSLNTGKSEETYPVKQLINETVDHTLNKNTSKSVMQMVNNGLIQLKPLWQKPHLKKIILCIVTHFGVLLGVNTLRLWLPQILISVENYNQINGIDNATVCQVIDESFQVDAMNNDNSTCVPVLSGDEVYISSIILAIVCVLGNFVIFGVINRWRKKYIIALLMIIAGLAALGNYWSIDSTVSLIVFIITIVFSLLCSITLMCLVVEIFPTNLRAMASCLTIMSGQFGALVGNLVFPILLTMGCLPPFLFISVILIVTGLIALVLPKGTM